MQNALKPTWKKSLTVIAVSLAIIVTSFILWANSTNPIMPRAEQALISDDTVAVFQADFISFIPEPNTTDSPQRGLILYPGGRVKAEAYAPIARAIAEQGYYVAIVYAPLNLAFFGINAAHAVIQANPTINHWAVGGHSLGGVAASLYAEQNPDTVHGLIIMASYPANNALRDRNDLAVTSIYATEDGLANPDDILASANDLPPNTTFVAIQGANHAYFGYYGEQSGDKPATITRDDFLAQLVPAITDLLDRMN